MDPSETTSTTSTTCPSPLLAAAAQRRIASVPKVADDAGLQHERRQHFRRLVDPGIRRPNSSGDALAAIEVSLSVVPHLCLYVLQMLSTIADNILREPDNPKYHRFKPTNPRIKKALVETKGALEYAVEVCPCSLVRPIARSLTVGVVSSSDSGQRSAVALTRGAPRSLVRSYRYTIYSPTTSSTRKGWRTCVSARRYSTTR